MSEISKALQVMQEPETGPPRGQEVPGVPSAAEKDPLEAGNTEGSLEKPATTRTLSKKETENASELQEKTSDSTSEHTEPSEMTASNVNTWIWPQNFQKSGMIYLDNEGKYWALTRPPQYAGPMSNPNLMCLIRIRSEFVSAYATGEHKKIYDCFDEQALDQPTKFDRPIKIWTPNEGDGMYTPICVRKFETEEPRKLEELNPLEVSEQPEKPMNSAESKQPDETMKTARSGQPEQMMQIERAERAEEAMQVAQSGRPEEAMKTAESETTEEALKAAESLRLVEAMETAESKRTEETLKAAESQRPVEAMETAESKRPEEPLKAAESQRPVEAMETAESKRTEEPLKAAESQRPVEAMETAESKRPEEPLKAAESQRPVEAMETAEAVGLKKTDNPKLTLKADKSNKLGNPEKLIIPGKLEEPENPAKIKRNRIPKDLEEPNIIKKARKALR